MMVITFVYRLLSSTNQSTPWKPSLFPVGLHSQFISIVCVSGSGYIVQRSRRNFDRCVAYLCLPHAWNIGTQCQSRSCMRPMAPWFDARASNAYSRLSQLNSSWFSLLWSRLLSGWSRRAWKFCPATYLWRISLAFPSMSSHFGLVLAKAVRSDNPVTCSQHTSKWVLMRCWNPSFNIQYLGLVVSFEESFGHNVWKSLKVPPLFSCMFLSLICILQIASTAAIRIWNTPRIGMSHCRWFFPLFSIEQNDMVVSWHSCVPRSPWHKWTCELYHWSAVPSWCSMFSTISTFPSVLDALMCITHAGCWTVFLIRIHFDEGTGPRRSLYLSGK